MVQAEHLRGVLPLEAHLGAGVRPVVAALQPVQASRVRDVVPLVDVPLLHQNGVA